MKKKIGELTAGTTFMTVGCCKQKVTGIANDTLCPCCGRVMIECDGRLMCPDIAVEVLV